KSDGDYVEMDEVICELESEKATFELTAEAAGVLHTHAQEGDSLEIGAVICTIDTDASPNAGTSEKTAEKTQDIPKKPDQEPKSEKAASTPTKDNSAGEIKEMVVPTVGESITEVTLATWLKNDGDFVA